MCWISTDNASRRAERLLQNPSIQSTHLTKEAHSQMPQSNMNNHLISKSQCNQDAYVPGISLPEFQVYMALEVAACLRPNAPSQVYESLALYSDIDINLSSRIKQDFLSSTTTLYRPSHAFEVCAERSPIFRLSASLPACLHAICEPLLIHNHQQRIYHSFGTPIELHLAYGRRFEVILPLSSHISASLNNLSPTPFRLASKSKDTVPYNLSSRSI